MPPQQIERTEPEIVGWEWVPPIAVPSPSRLRLQPPSWVGPLPGPEKSTLVKIAAGFALFPVVVGWLLLLMLLEGDSNREAINNLWRLMAIPFTVAVIFVIVDLAKAKPSNRAEANKLAAYAANREQWRNAIENEEQSALALYRRTNKWYANTVNGNQPIKIYGGDDRSWAGFLRLYTNPKRLPESVTIVDFTRNQISKKVLETHDNISYQIQEAPTWYDPLADTTRPQNVVTALASPLTGETDRDVELTAGFYQSVTQILGDQPSLDRLNEAINYIGGIQSHESLLTDVEKQQLRSQSLTTLLGGHAEERIAHIRLTLKSICDDAISEPSTKQNPPTLIRTITVDPQLDDIAHQRLCNLVGSSIAHQTSRPATSHATVIVGADLLHKKILEQIAENAKQTGSRLIVMYRDLTDVALETLGRDNPLTMFFRLGNRQDAETAADHIGKEHQFVLNSIGVDRGTNTSRSNTFTPGTGTTTGRTWGSSTSQSASLARSEEYRVRAEDLQKISETGFVLVSASNDRVISLGDVNPAIENSGYDYNKPVLPKTANTNTNPAPDIAQLIGAVNTLIGNKL